MTFKYVAEHSEDIANDLEAFSRLDKGMYVLNEIVSLLSDSSVKVKTFNSDKVDDLYDMFNAINNSYSNLFKTRKNQIKNVLPFAKIEAYKIKTSERVRTATVGEIESGASGLIENYIFNIPEQDIKYLNLLEWLNNGMFRNLNAAVGDKIKYGDSTDEILITIKDDIWELIQNVPSDRVTSLVKQLNVIKKQGEFAYPSSAVDEIKEPVSFKQIAIELLDIVPKGSTNADYRRAIALSLRFKEGKELTPIQKSWMRDFYKGFDRQEIQKKEKKQTNEDLKDQCEFIIHFSSLLGKDKFVLQIIETLKNRNYVSCSEKQYTYIYSALELITTELKKKEAEQEEAKKEAENKPKVSEETSSMLNKALNKSNNTEQKVEKIIDDIFEEADEDTKEDKKNSFDSINVDDFLIDEDDSDWKMSY